VIGGRWGRLWTSGLALAETQSVSLADQRVLDSLSPDTWIRLCVVGYRSQGLEMRPTVHSVLSRENLAF
jgi:hypothetical protein